MSNHDLELIAIEQKFECLNQDIKEELLKYQCVWQDWKMQSIFQGDHEEAIRNGRSRYPIGWEENHHLAFTDEEIWTNQPFMIVITEWIKEVPMYRFESIGHYLSFIKSVYCQQDEIICKILKSKNSKEFFLKIDDTNFGDWKVFKNYFCYKGYKAIEMQKK
jgi:hypothetical protein